MTSGGYGPVLRQVGRLLGAGGTAAALGEGALLRRFAEARDGPAFEALVARHGPMVLGTCRRILADPHAVDDAFQATFLVLARKAGSIRDGDRLGPWLHGVARRVATRSRAQAARRAARERPGAEDRAVTDPDPADARELRAALDEELARLPEKYRAPLVLCHLQGLTHDEAARQLGWPVGTVRSRLARGRDRLRSGLTRRGLSPSAAIPAIPPAAAISEALLSTTVRIATTAGSAPAHVASLAKGALIAMTWHKLKAVAAVGLLGGSVVGGAGALAQQGGKGAPAPVEPTPKIEARPAEAQLALVKKDRDRLRAEVDEVIRRMDQIRYEKDRQLGELEPRLAEHKARLEEFEERWKALVLQGPASPKPKEEVGKMVGPAPGPGRGDAGGPQMRTVMPLPGEPTILTIPAEQDRVTLIDTATGGRKVYRAPEGITQLQPLITGGVVALLMKGPRITQLAVFDRRAKEWSTHDLREPAAGQVSPVAGEDRAEYQIGKFFYIYSVPARRWSVLELGRKAQGPAGMFGSPWMPGSNPAEGKMMISEGDVIHVYDIKTGQWSQIDTRDEK